MSWPWFRLYNDILNDEKFVYISNQIDVSKMELVGIWVSLLMLANKSPIRGYLMLTPKIPYGLVDLSTITGVEASKLATIIHSFVDAEMIVLDVLGEFLADENMGKLEVWKLTNWDKRQFTSDNSTERVKQHRNTKSTTNDETTLKQPCNDDETPPYNILHITNNNNTDIQNTNPNNSDDFLSDPIAVLYQSKIGLIVPLIKDKLVELKKSYPMDWINGAFEIAIKQGTDTRNLRYIEGILKKWKAQGYMAGSKKQPIKHDTPEGRKKYGEWETQ